MPAWRERLLRWALNPREEKRLQQFQLLAAAAFYTDYFVTFVLIGYYDFPNQDTSFIKYQEVYIIILIIQVIEILLNFITI